MQNIESPHECRKQIASVHDPKGAWFCEFCQHYSLTDNEQTCQCCYNKIIRKRAYYVDLKKYYTDLKAFESVLLTNESIIRAFQTKPYISETMPGFVVKFGLRTQLVNIKHFSDYMSIENKKDMKIVLPFLAKVKVTSYLLMPGTRVI